MTSFATWAAAWILLAGFDFGVARPKASTEVFRFACARTVDAGRSVTPIAPSGTCRKDDELLVVVTPHGHHHGYYAFVMTTVAGTQVLVSDGYGLWLDNVDVLHSFGGTGPADLTTHPKALGERATIFALFGDRPISYDVAKRCSLHLDFRPDGLEVFSQSVTFK